MIEEIKDQKTEFPVIDSQEVWRGQVFSMMTEHVRYGEEIATRDFVKHPGAVAIVPLREGEATENPKGEPEVLLINQYRHPVRASLWEIPAGLLDVAGENALEAAKRELAEEVESRAGRWDVLVDYFTTPGGSSEALRVFLARDLTPIPVEERHFAKEAEEAFMTKRWVTLREAVLGIFEGRIHNPSAVVGLLAARVALQERKNSLRAPDAAWLR